jgi:hypothetical protein
MTSQLLAPLPFVGIGVGLFWLGLCWVAAFRERVMPVMNPLWHWGLHDILMISAGAKHRST